MNGHYSTIHLYYSFVAKAKAFVKSADILSLCWHNGLPFSKFNSSGTM